MSRFYIGLFAVMTLVAVSYSGVVIPQLSEQSEARHFRRNLVTFCYTPRYHSENSRTIRVAKFWANILIRFNLGYLGECDSDGDGVPDNTDECTNDPNKSEAGQCGCGNPDTDTDQDGIADCNDLCPNGTIDSNEQCDPPGNPCDSDGDGFLDGFCDAQCQCPLPPPNCGDENIDPDEECDDGNSNNGDGCRINCTEEICGDGIKDPQEECDDGNNADDDGCQGDCTLPSCGDGVIDPLEACDDQGESAECDDDCSLVMCGDGKLNQTAGEECDDGNDTSGDGCSNSCQSESVCGNGVIEGNEACDDGNTASDDGCSATCSIVEDGFVCPPGGGSCRPIICGDDNVDPGEECDPPGGACDFNMDGNIDDGKCDDQCQCQALPAGCGDAVKNRDETDVDCGGSCLPCVEGKDCSTNSDCESNFCAANVCQATACGDGVVQGNEECDDGAANSDSAPDACRTNCINPFCGDGVQDTSEECDDGNNETGDGCREDCTILGCGDGIGDSEVFVNDGVLSFFIDTYEASRPDADSVLPGVAEHRACSSPDKQPWVNVSWTEADAACTAAGKRLCTEEEWELACAGTADNMFPYGNDYDDEACNGKDYNPNCSGEDVDLALPTGTDYGCPPPGDNACESEFSAFDMSGNVEEWTATQVLLDPPSYQVRGGSFDSVGLGLTCQFDFTVLTESASAPFLGFRCCRDPQCAAGFGNCDGDPSNGCETSLNTVSNCGDCDSICSNPNGSTSCIGGACAPTCAPGFDDCDGDPSNGCETDLNNDLNNCGGCDNVCPDAGGSPNCVGGICGVES